MTTNSDLSQRVSATSWDIVEVTFDTADTDVEIQHHLTPSDPEQIDYWVLDASGPPLVYRDTSSTRVKWNAGVIRLRSAVAGLKCRLLLTIPYLTKNLIQGGARILSRSLLPGELAYEDEANVFTQGQRISHATGPTLYLKRNGTDEVAFYAYGGNTYLDSIGSFFLRTFAGTERFTVDSSGNIIKFGGQIKFPSSQAASSDANTLDDYEEGNWSPIIGGVGGESGQTYGFQSGRYQKIGKRVFIYCYVALSVVGTITGSLLLKGLPFSAENSANVYGPIACPYWYSLGISPPCIPGGYMLPNTATAYINKSTGGSGISVMTSADLAAGSGFMFVGQYNTDN